MSGSHKLRRSWRHRVCVPHPCNTVLFAFQQDINEVRAAYAETEATVKADADPACTICGGKGWHDGWDAATLDPVRLRCPCVNRRR